MVPYFKRSNSEGVHRNVLPVLNTNVINQYHLPLQLFSMVRESMQLPCFGKVSASNDIYLFIWHYIYMYMYVHTRMNPWWRLTAYLIQKCWWSLFMITVCDISIRIWNQCVLPKVCITFTYSKHMIFWDGKASVR
jgi:hypothetical protein